MDSLTSPRIVSAEVVVKVRREGEGVIIEGKSELYNWTLTLTAEEAEEVIFGLRMALNLIKEEAQAALPPLL